VSTATTETSNDGREAGRPAAAPRRGLRRLVPRRLRRSAKTEPKAARSGRRRWPLIVGLTVILAVFAGLGYVVFISPVLAVTSVSVTGASDELANEVRAAADIANGTPLARIDLDAVAAMWDRSGSQPQFIEQNLRLARERDPELARALRSALEDHRLRWELERWRERARLARARVRRTMRQWRPAR